MKIKNTSEMYGAFHKAVYAARETHKEAIESKNAFAEIAAFHLVAKLGELITPIERFKDAVLEDAKK